jgi:hypothetical protein
MSNFLQRLFGTRAARRLPAAQLRVEPLDGRDCPSVTVIPGPGAVTVIGDAAADTVVIVQDDAANRLTVQYNSAAGPASVTFPSLPINRVNAFLQGGEDRLDYRLVSDLLAPKVFTNFLGAGDDRATYDVGVRNPRVIRASLVVDVYGEAGRDMVQAEFGAVSAAPVQFVASMGTESDYCSASLRGVMVGGARGRFDLRGEAGSDTLKFANVNSTWPPSRLDVLMTGGDGDDVLAMFIDGTMSGAYRLHLDGGAGQDYVDADVTARFGSTGSLDLNVRGGDDDDQMRTRFINLAPGPLNVLQAVMDGGAGTDTVLPGTTPNVVLVNFP